MLKYLFLVILFSSVSKAEDPLFLIGETCNYNVYFMGINAGSIKTKIDENKSFKDQVVFILTNEIKTSGIASAFYKLKQNTKSYWSKKYQSLRHEFEISENSDNKKGIEEVNYSSKTYLYEKEGSNKEEIKIEEDESSIQDYTSIAYYVRTIDWSEKNLVKKIQISDFGNIKTIELKSVSEEVITKKDSYKISLKYQDNKEDFFWIEKNNKRQIIKMKLKTNAGSLESHLENCTY